MATDYSNGRPLPAIPEEDLDIEEFETFLQAVADNEEEVIEEVFVFKAKCKACTVRIGYGYYDTPIYYDILKRRMVCGGCARTTYWSDDYDEERYYPIATREEIRAYAIPHLNLVLNKRIEEIEREQGYDDPPKRRGRRKSGGSGSQGTSED